jgi:hypothetical protein
MAPFLNITNNSTSSNSTNTTSGNVTDVSSFAYFDVEQIINNLGKGALESDAGKSVLEKTVLAAVIGASNVTINSVSIGTDGTDTNFTVSATGKDFHTVVVDVTSIVIKIFKLSNLRPHSEILKHNHIAQQLILTLVTNTTITNTTLPPGGSNNTSTNTTIIPATTVQYSIYFIYTGTKENAAAKYAILVDELNSSITRGRFTDLLRSVALALNVPGFDQAEANLLPIIGPLTLVALIPKSTDEPTNAPTEAPTGTSSKSSNDKQDAGMIAGVTIGVFVFVCLLCCLLWFCCGDNGTRNRKFSTWTRHDSTYENTHSADPHSEAGSFTNNANANNAN